MNCFVTPVHTRMQLVIYRITFALQVGRKKSPRVVHSLGHKACCGRHLANDPKTANTSAVGEVAVGESWLISRHTGNHVDLAFEGHLNISGKPLGASAAVSTPSVRHCQNGGGSAWIP